MAKTKFETIGALKTIMSNPDGKHNYFGWPSITRLKNGKLAAVASGFRLRHVCPFGKMVVAFSEDEGEHFTPPAPIIDTPLDDRDGGILAFGEAGVVVTSFNNTVAFQRKQPTAAAYSQGYLDTVTPEEEEKYLGSTFRISFDNGSTFSEILHSPITCPHGPIELSDGTLFYIGRKFSRNNAVQSDDCVMAYRLNPDGTMEYLGSVENIDAGPDEKLLSCEPHAIELKDGRILAHIRVQSSICPPGQKRMFTIYQTISEDGGKTWEKPYPILPRQGGSPPHLLRHSSGVLICSYAVREEPFTINLMFSYDEGKTWEEGQVLHTNGVSLDLGYPATVELKDGSLLTVFYAHRTADEPATILSQKWRILP